MLSQKERTVTFEFDSYQHNRYSNELEFLSKSSRKIALSVNHQSKDYPLLAKEGMNIRPVKILEKNMKTFPKTITLEYQP